MANDIGPLAVTSNDIGPLDNNDVATGPDTPTGMSVTMSGATAVVSLDRPSATAATLRIERQKDGGGYSSIGTVSVTPTFSPPNKASPIGTNLNFLSYYDPTLPFKDISKMATEWIPQDHSWTFDTGIPLTLGSDGYPSSLGANEAAGVLLCRSLPNGDYPSGTYDVFFDGDGAIAVTYDAGSLTEISTGHWQFTVTTPTTNGIWFQIRETNPSDHLRNLRIVMPGYSGSYESDRWNPDFISVVENYSCVRFMDWMYTNNSTVEDFADLNTIDSKWWGSSTAHGGPPISVMCDLCNKISADMWICIPHLATDACVSAMAEQVKQYLDLDLDVYVEYSNEVWNGLFTQNLYSRTMGQATIPGDNEYHQGWQWYGVRSVEVFDLFHAVFAGQEDRVKRVLCGQAVSTAPGEYALLYDDNYLSCDYYSVASYFSNDFTQSEATIEAYTLTELMDDIAAYQQQTVTWITAQQTMLANNSISLPMVFYEGGQHLSYPSNTTIANLFIDANNDSRMGDIYKETFEELRDVVGNALHMHYLAVSTYGIFGSWGILETLNDTTPKNTSLNEFIDENPLFYVEDGLTETGTYDYRAVAIDGSANESSASTSTQVVFGTDDLKPLYFTATKDGSDVDLAWLAVGGSDSYIAQRSPNGVDTWTQIATPTSPSATDTNPGTGTWYYRVAAVVDAITGDWSDTTSVTYLSANTNTATASITLPSLGITASAEVSSSPGQTEISATADITLPSLGITASATNETLTLPGIPSSINVYLESPNIKIEWGAATSAVSYTVEMDLASSGYSELSSGITSPLSATVAYPGVGTQRFRVYATNPNGNGGTIQGFLYTAPVTPSFTGTGRGFLGKSLLELKLSL